MRTARETILILDYGSQYTQLIARRIRELQVHSFVLPGDATLDEIKARNPLAVVLSGGPSSVYDEGAPDLPAGFLEYQRAEKFPVLGICYGLQLIVHRLGGKVFTAEQREYGRMQVKNQASVLLSEKSFFAWMSHGDETKELPAGFKTTAVSQAGAIAAVENVEAKIFGLQFHPEVTHTEHGIDILKKFVFDISGAHATWTMSSVAEEQIKIMSTKVGPTDHVICALSGGVDSAVAAVLAHRVLGDRLHCVFVDHGLLRFEEQARVMKMFKDRLKLPVVCVDASERFLSKLKGVTDPEKKRKIIGAEFIEVFDESANSLKQKLGKKPRFLIQGTLYPDVIESSPAPNAKGSISKHSVTIKSHHNVGGLPEKMDFELIEPLRELFKDEVRKLGAELGVPNEFLKRHPFPGPGLAVRVLTDIRPEYLEILRKADEVFIQALYEHGIYDDIWQAFAVFLPIRSVGVQGDGRTHDHCIALRAVNSKDGMTADWYPFQHEFLKTVSSRICNEVRGVNRVVYDISSKPPATIEWE